jgi:acyl-CoA-dependent ceramide synthase
MEQGWYLIYYSISFPMGAYILYHSNYATNFDNLYIGWPHDQMSFLFKGYYLLEMACWLQQIFILNIEDRRKDHYQMFSHHIITCLLVGGSYYYYFTKIGNVILVIMDLVDIFFAAAKLLKYSGFQTSCDLMFGLFVIVWIALRHGLYNYIFYHTATKARDLMMSGKCIEGVIQKRCWTDNVITIFLSLLGGLQIITIIWMYLIAKVAVKVITGAPAEDVRSDDEED